MFTLLITDPAKQDLQAAFDWWREHRSSEQAARWYGIPRSVRWIEMILRRVTKAQWSRLTH